jgi:hypothetical protein
MLQALLALLAQKKNADAEGGASTALRPHLRLCLFGDAAYLGMLKAGSLRPHTLIH